MAVNTHNKVAKNASAVKKNTASAGHALLRAARLLLHKNQLRPLHKLARR